MKQARIRRGKTVSRLMITDPIVGEFAVDDKFTLELLELLHPPEIRLRLPHSGWRRVSVRILIVLLGSGVIRMVEENST